MRRRPEIAEGISETLARRRVELDAILEADEQALRERMKKTQGFLLGRIREFFRLGSDRSGKAS